MEIDPQAPARSTAVAAAAAPGRPVIVAPLVEVEVDIVVAVADSAAAEEGEEDGDETIINLKPARSNHEHPKNICHLWPSRNPWRAVGGESARGI